MAVTAPVRLQATSALIRALGHLSPMTHPRRGVTAWPAMLFIVATIFFATAAFCAAGFWLPADKSNLAYLIAAAALFLPGLLWVVTRVATTVWWTSGAGHPMLELADGELRGRIRPVLAGEPTPDATSWWDFRVPISDVRAIRLVDHHLGPGLAVDLPPDVELTLWTMTDLDQTLRQNQTLANSPAAWWLMWYFPIRGRDTRVQALLAALESSGAQVIR